MACGALFRCRHQVAHRAVDSLVCHTAVGANLPSTLVQSSQRTVCQLGVVLHRYRLDCIYIYNACHLFPFLYVKLHRVLRNATVHNRGRKDMSDINRLMWWSFQPLRHCVTPPLYFAWQNTPQCYGARQGRRRIVQACYIADILIDRKEIKKRGYIETMYPLFSERKTRLKLATLSLEGWCSINWATSAIFLWAKMDSNHRRRKPADLQSAPFGHSGICP